MLLSASDKAKLFTKKSPKFVKKVMTNLDFSNVSVPEFIPVVVLKNYEPELSCKLVALFNMCHKESFFPDCWKVSSVALVLKNFGERSTAKSYHLVSFLSVVSKVFEKLSNKRLVDHLKKYVLFLISSIVLGLLNQLKIF